MQYAPRLILSIPWGKGEEDIPAAPRPLVHQTGAMPPASKRYIRPLYGVRIDDQGHSYVLFAVPQEALPNRRRYRLLQFNQAGSLVNRFEFALKARKVQVWNILDFCPDHAGGIIILERMQSPAGDLTQRLRRLDAKGRRKWQRNGAFSLQSVDFIKFSGHFNRIFMPAENLLYLPAHFPQRGLARLNPANGKTSEILRWPDNPASITPGPANKIFYAHLVEEKQRKKIVLIRFDPASGSRDVIDSDIQNLHNLAGIDRQGCIYPRVHDGIARLSPAGQLQWQSSIYGIVLRESDGHTFICSRAEIRATNVILAVNRYDMNGAPVQTYSFECQRRQIAVTNDTLRFIHVDSDLQFYFHGGESVTDAGMLASFTPEGNLKETVALSEGSDSTTLFDKLNDLVLPIESRIDSPNMIEVDVAGRIYIPLSDPAGFKVVCFQPAI